MIKDGGKASNVITDYASCEFCVRADTVYDMNIAEKEVENVVKSVNCLYGTTSRITKGLVCTERYPNKSMADRYRVHMEYFGEKVEYPSPNLKVGSSDIGNVSLQVPTIHPYLKICEFSSHTKGFKMAARSEHAQEQAVKAAKALAMTAYDILSLQNLRDSIMKEFKKKVPFYTEAKLGYNQSNITKIG